MRGEQIPILFDNLIVHPVLLYIILLSGLNSYVSVYENLFVGDDDTIHTVEEEISQRESSYHVSAIRRELSLDYIPDDLVREA